MINCTDPCARLEATTLLLVVSAALFSLNPAQFLFLTVTFYSCFAEHTFLLCCQFSAVLTKIWSHYCLLVD